eukprot:scaffold44731_cov48-Attheya_sp.AAC.1
MNQEEEAPGSLLQLLRLLRGLGGILHLHGLWEGIVGHIPQCRQTSYSQGGNYIDCSGTQSTTLSGGSFTFVYTQTQSVDKEPP